MAPGGFYRSPDVSQHEHGAKRAVRSGIHGRDPARRPRRRNVGGRGLWAHVLSRHRLNFQPGSLNACPTMLSQGPASGARTYATSDYGLDPAGSLDTEESVIVQARGDTRNDSIHGIDVNGLSARIARPRFELLDDRTS